MPLLRTLIQGELEIQHGRGVIYFHASSIECRDNGHQPTPMRIQGLRLDYDVKQKQIDLRFPETEFDTDGNPQDNASVSGTPDKELGAVVVPRYDTEGQNYEYDFDNLQDVRATIIDFIKDEETGDDITRAFGMLRGINRLISNGE